MKYLSFVLVFFLVVGCVSKSEYEQAVAERDLLKANLEKEEELNNEITQKMDEVGVLLDSIESQDETISFSLEKGTSYNDFSARLEDINDYISNSKERIEEMESLLANSNSKNAVLSNMIAKLRKSVEQKESEITALTEQVNKYRNENNALIKTVDLQNRELKERERLIEEKREELAGLETKIEDMTVAAKKAEADAYFAQASSKEETANRTKLAPKKKKATYKEAYDLYKLAFEAGREDAYAKMEELEGKL